MSLPILKSNFTANDTDLLRFAGQVNIEWARHLGEETALDCGRAFTSPSLASVHYANCILDASVPADSSPQIVYDQVQSHFDRAGSMCEMWSLSPSLNKNQAAALEELLLAKSFRKDAEQVCHLPHMPAVEPHQITGLKIIPARASFRHYRSLADEQARSWNTLRWADADMLHLDDSHYDALLALQDGVAAGCIGVLSVGEIGAIQGLYVAEKFRRQGIARLLMNRALEICLRSLFRHVLLTSHPENVAANHLYDQLGFRVIGQIASYFAPGAAMQSP